MASKNFTISSEDPKTGTIKTPVLSKYRRTYQHLQDIARPAPFYTQQGERIIDEASIRIVKRKDRNARQKLMRYRAAYPAYGN